MEFMEFVQPLEVGVHNGTDRQTDWFAEKKCVISVLNTTTKNMPKLTGQKKRDNIF